MATEIIDKELYPSIEMQKYICLLSFVEELWILKTKEILIDSNSFSKLK